MSRMEELTRTQARAVLTDWRNVKRQHDQASRKLDTERDHLVMLALTAGLQKKEIFELTGVARSTINRIQAAAAAGNGVT